MADGVNINDLLDGHVGLDLECLDRIYLNVYVPKLQVGGQVVRFLTEHLGNPIPSPVLFQRIGERFRRDVARFAERNHIPLLHLKRPDRSRWDDRKLDHVRPYLERATTPGVVAIVCAQEFQKVFVGVNRSTKPGVACFDFPKVDRRVSVYYFYVLDPEFGPGFIKLCSYFPYPGKIWLNGHEWAKRQADREGVAFTALANGFATCQDPARLQQLCDRLGPTDLQGFFDRWIAVLPTPFTAADRAAGYWWELSMRQVEVSRTIVFNQPRHARGFFEALCADNLDIGRPEQMQLVFGRRVRTPPPDGYRTRLLRAGDEVTLNAHFRHSRVKSYLKCGRAFRIETVVNDTGDLGVARRIEHLPEIFAKARDVNRRMVDAFRVGQGCVLASPAFERAARPTLEDGRRAPALRFGDPRVMALVGALCASLHVITGFTNRSLRARVATQLGVPYSMSQMSYDLRRLRMKGLINRLPRSNTYVLTPDGQRVTIFYTKLHNRLLRPLAAANDPPAPLPLRQALRVIDRHIADYIAEARMLA
jgi:hypothetical protein